MSRQFLELHFWRLRKLFQSLQVNPKTCFLVHPTLSSKPLLRHIRYNTLLKLLCCSIHSFCQGEEGLNKSHILLVHHSRALWRAFQDNFRLNPIFCELHGHNFYKDKLYHWDNTAQLDLVFHVNMSCRASFLLQAWLDQLLLCKSLSREVELFRGHR